jgi:general secretion pathway protein G
MRNDKQRNSRLPIAHCQLPIEQPQRRTTEQAGKPVPRLGFTLIELLLVLVILAILAGVVVPRFTKRSEQAKTTAATTDISSLATALRTFEIDCGRYPTNEEGLSALLTQPGNVNGWKGPYLERGVLPKDPWGNPYVYHFPGQHNTDYDLYSFGPDGTEGGGDDIDNWSQK